MKNFFILLIVAVSFFSCEEKENFDNYPIVGYDTASGNPFLGQWISISDTVYEGNYKYMYLLEFTCNFIQGYNYSNKGGVLIDLQRVTSDGSLPGSKRYSTSKYIYNDNLILLYDNQKWNENKGKWKDVIDNPLLGKEKTYSFEKNLTDTLTLLHINNKVFKKLKISVPK